jgi:hypothetical protein
VWPWLNMYVGNYSSGRGRSGGGVVWVVVYGQRGELSFTLRASGGWIGRRELRDARCTM